MSSASNSLDGALLVQRNPVEISLDWECLGASVSSTLYGLFLEDINFGVDGGLNANLVANWSFEGTYLNRTNGYSLMSAVLFRRKAFPLSDPLRHWEATGGSLAARAEESDHHSSRFARLEVNGEARLKNAGYLGGKASMGAHANIPLLFRARARVGAFEGSLRVELIDAQEMVVARSELNAAGPDWQRVEATLTPPCSGLFALQIVAKGRGSIDLDDVSLCPSDHWGAGDPRWSQGVMRRDMVEAIRALRPSFLRFPGGCVVEGVGEGTQYDWRYSVGPLDKRTSQFNLWAESRENGDYAQSNQIGFYEYFLLCEDLGMEPIPVVWAGLSCQFRSNHRLSHDSVHFAAVIQSAVDMVDWATGDPATSAWARLRAEAGHPEPFKLNYVGIGNENHGKAYRSHFDAIKAALDKERPGMSYILAAGAFPKGKAWEGSFKHAKGRSDVIVDEHSYAHPKWFLDRTTRYDDIPRSGERIMLGEYAAHPAFSLAALFNRDTPNTWQSAVAEAAFLTGVERNADLVAMTCYAPLFANYRCKQWSHNLIDFSSLAVRPSVNYEVQRLFGEAVGERVVPVAVESGQDLHASATGNDAVVHVKLVNAGTRDQTVRLAPGGTFSAEMVLLRGKPMDRAIVKDETTTVAPISRKVQSLGTGQREVTLRLPAHSVARIDLKRG